MYEFRLMRPEVWKVLGGQRTYVVSKAMNNWFCTCDAGSFRGMCKHICSIQVEHDPLLFFPHSIPEIAVLSKAVFDGLWRMPRFVAEPLCVGPRQIVVFGPTPHFFDKIGNEVVPMFAIDLEKSMELAGTVADLITGCPYDPGVVYVHDVPVWKGPDLSHRPLRDRFDYIDKVAQVVPGLQSMHWAYNYPGKWLLWKLLNGRCVIKDVNSPYRKTRGWFVRGRKEKEAS